MANHPIDKPKKKGPKVTMSTEAIARQASDGYWVDVDATKIEENNVVVKPGPKPESKDNHCPGDCLAVKAAVVKYA